MLRPVAVVLLVLVPLIAGSVAAAAPANAAPGASPASDSSGHVLLNEFANGGQHSESDTFVELRNWGTTAVDLSAWHLYRCTAQGLRSNTSDYEGDLSGVTLAPGAVFTISKVGMPGDQHVTQPYDSHGFGLYLEGPGGTLVDRIGVYPTEPWPQQSECSPSSGNLTNSLNFARNESWQRVADTGDVSRDFIVAPATLDAANASAPEARASSKVVISELTGAGPKGPDDDFVELRNDGKAAADIGGWTLDRCTTSGRLRTDTRQLTIADGTTLAPGATWVAGAPGFGGQAHGYPADATYPVHLGDVEFGVQLRTAKGELVDRVAVSSYGDSACQDDDTKLAAILDAAHSESWQRLADGSGWVVAPRTPGAPNARAADSVFDETFAYPSKPGVAISELATDPTTEGMPAGSVQRNWIELGNYGDAPVDIGGWTVSRCVMDGTRAVAPQFTVPAGTMLAPGGTFLAARAGTEAAARADATYGTSLNFLGTGVWVADAAGHRVDSMGAYEVNEMDRSRTTPSPCTKGTSLATYLPDRLLGQTYQRTRFTGVDDDDFVVGGATPGKLDLVPWVDPTLRVSGVQGPGTAKASGNSGGGSGGGLDTPPSAALDRRVLDVWGGVSDAPLATLRGERETLVAAGAAVEDSGYRFPYQRLVLDASDLVAGSTVDWSGTTLPRQELQFSVWNGSKWRRLDAASGAADGSVALRGELEGGDIRDGKVTLLVQDGPRTKATIASAPDGRLENPADYDLALTHITDTQYLTENYPAVFAQLTSWIAENAATRKIAFAMDTGDIVQNWVDPDQDDVRARREFTRASAIFSILDDARVPYSVLPGNHDSKRGVDRSLFNDYFAPSRYSSNPWWGGSIGPDDNSANFSVIEQAGAKLLLLSLPYAYGDRELDWAEAVIAAHPDSNVVIATHEHVTPKAVNVAAARSVGARWVSHGQQLWDRIIAPNRNVIMVLAGHYHGVGQIVSENVGGIPGHTVVEMLADYQEFRTATGERNTGFQRLLQMDLASGTVAIDTFSVRLGATASYPYDYMQFLRDNGLPLTPSNERPWNIVANGLQGRYTVDDDEFDAHVRFQYEKTVVTWGVVVGGSRAAATSGSPASPAPSPTPSPNSLFDGIRHRLV